MVLQQRTSVRILLLSGDTSLEIPPTSLTNSFCANSSTLLVQFATFIGVVNDHVYVTVFRDDSLNSRISRFL
jgi:hypothetical protein